MRLVNHRQTFQCKEPRKRCECSARDVESPPTDSRTKEIERGLENPCKPTSPRKPSALTNRPSKPIVSSIRRDRYPSTRKPPTSLKATSLPKPVKCSRILRPSWKPEDQRSTASSKRPCS